MKCILIATLTVGKFVFYSISQDALSFSDVRSCCSSHHELPFIADSISLGFYFFIAAWALSNRDVHFSVF